MPPETAPAPEEAAPPTADETPAPPETDDGGIPDGWSEDARGTFEAVLEQRPDLAGAALGALWQACSLESAADHLDEVASAAGYVAVGSKGQVVVHPAVTEARLARTAAAQILARLVPAPSKARMTASERGRTAAMSRWSARQA